MRGATGLLWKTCFLTQLEDHVTDSCVPTHNTINFEEQEG
ncbi:hypothetical protein OROMI_021101 [Orobanche minor]